MSVGSISGAAQYPPDLLTTRDQMRPGQRLPDFGTETVAFRDLSTMIAENPRQALRRIPEVARLLCNAGTAGLSLLRSDTTGHETIYWTSVNGALDSHEGFETPRDFSPCGLCLDAGETVLVSQPARVFSWLQLTRPMMIEDLIVPLLDANRKPLGTIWIAHHDVSSRFTTNDARILEQLAIHLVLTLRLLEQARDRRRSLETGEAVKRVLNHDLTHERARRSRAEASEKRSLATLSIDHSQIREAHHRIKNTIQIASSLLSLQARATTSSEVRDALQQGQTRLHVLAKVHELLYRESNDTREILMAELLQEICDALTLLFGEKRVQLRLTCGPIRLPSADAIPIALLANEAITNAYKHAFPGDTAGNITIELSRLDAATLRLQITDNGSGVESRENSTGLGLKLMRSFAIQLQGKISITNSIDGRGTLVLLEMQRDASTGDPSATQSAHSD